RDFHVTGVQTCALPISGNYLAGAAVVDSAATVLRDGVEALAGGTDAGDLADLLLAALEAAQAEGGDRRGERSAVVLVGATAEQGVGRASCREGGARPGG